MNVPAARGRFITFEGGEGAGKSTQCAALAERLGGLGLRVIRTREPGGSPRAEEIRSVILSGTAARLGPLAEALLFYAARADHLAATIRPALARGDWVVCDRFSDSTRAYQGAAGGVKADVLAALERIVVGEDRPDLTVILDLPAAVGLERAARRRGDGETDRFEQEALSFHEALREGFLAIAAREPGRCVVIDAGGSPGSVADAVWNAVRQRLNLTGPAENAS
ncbi:dTMP kinase [Alsobacter sp. R-9]